jgi:hypothetical protein
LFAVQTGIWYRQGWASTGSSSKQNVTNHNHGVSSFVFDSVLQQQNSRRCSNTIVLLLLSVSTTAAAAAAVQFGPSTAATITKL